MQLRRVSAPLLWLVAFTCMGFGQVPDYEYGKPEELKGVKKIYVFTDRELELHDNIVKNILKKLPHLIVTEQPEQADVILVFAARSTSLFAGLSGESTVQNDTIYSSSSANYTTVTEGHGNVIRLVSQNPIRFRLLMEFRDTRSLWWLERRTSTNFARAFVKAYEAANNLGKK